MTDQNRSLTKGSNANSLVSVWIAGALILGSIAGLIFWALQAAYTFG
ncbi:MULTISPECIES: hypothetical protein [unclassified Leptolyngbya]|nr:MULTISPECIES: hypothetical protein [unclassified Leptolyngbya]MBD1911014.1 hypothetical protein [Leptolyngbya sp. FACHB-8]MBD2158319.1 hypothetical protein [Leptolyngbya sp. FACHB-16]